MNQTRDHVIIRGRAILHSTAVRDWVCGECGGRLVTRWVGTPQGWRTICSGDQEHDPDNFIHKMSWAHLESECIKEDMVAQDVFRNLPAELREAIDERREKCQLKE